MGINNQKGFYEFGHEVAFNPVFYGDSNDGESDWYYFTVNGTTHKLVFDAFKKAHFFSESDIRDSSF